MELAKDDFRPKTDGQIPWMRTNSPGDHVNKKSSKIKKLRKKHLSPPADGPCVLFCAKGRGGAISDRAQACWGLCGGIGKERGGGGEFWRPRFTRVETLARRIFG